MGQHWTNRIARPDVRFGSMLLKKSAARSSKATIESRRTGHWIDVASSVKTGKAQVEQLFSGLHSKADRGERGRHFRLVPEADHLIW